jgi:DNA-binding IclR family transcriptional regulator
LTAKHDAARVFGLIHQAGPLGATANELAAWTGMALNVVEQHLRTLRRLGKVQRTTTHRTTHPGTSAPVYIEAA